MINKVNNEYLITCYVDQDKNTCRDSDISLINQSEIPFLKPKIVF